MSNKYTKENGWGRYTLGRKCSICTKRILNFNVSGKCVSCNSKREVILDPKSKLYREKYPEKVKARLTLFRYIKNGKIKRGKCEICSKPNAEAHHKDYSKPLEVEWLCKKHHADLEATTRIVSKLESGEKLSEYYLKKLSTP